MEFVPLWRIEDKGFEELQKDVIHFIEEMYPDKKKTFKVEARRAKKQYPMNSMEINCELGGAILDAFPEMKVDVHHPDIRSECRNQRRDLSVFRD